MDSHLFVALEDVINQWIEVNCQDSRWPEVYVYEDQGKDMAKAAALVFDASVKGQQFMEIENG